MVILVGIVEGFEEHEEGKERGNCAEDRGCLSALEAAAIHTRVGLGSVRVHFGELKIVK